MAKTKAEIELELAGVRKASVRTQVQKGGRARWGEAESLAVVGDIVEAFCGDEDAMAEGSGVLLPLLRPLINPSAFAQSLEKLPAEHPAHIRRPARGSGGSRKADEY